MDKPASILDGGAGVGHRINGLTTTQAFTLLSCCKGCVSEILGLVDATVRLVTDGRFSRLHLIARLGYGGDLGGSII